MPTKKITLSIPIEYAAYLSKKAISPSRLFQNAIKEIMMHDAYYIATKKVDTYDRRNRRSRKQERGI